MTSGYFLRTLGLSALLLLLGVAQGRADETPSGETTASESVTLPPANWIDISATSSTGRVSYITGTVSSGVEAIWYSVRINKYQPYTFWTTNIVSSGITSLAVFSETTGAAALFSVSEDEDGNRRAILRAENWNARSEASILFYFRLTGVPGTQFKLAYRKAVVEQVVIGSRERPKEFNFFETVRAPVNWYDSISGTTLTNGYYYYSSELVANQRYYFGISTNTPSSVLFAVESPSGDEERLEAFPVYRPWNAETTNVNEVVDCLTNREEVVTVVSRYTVISNMSEEVTNVYTVVGVYTNTIESFAQACSNLYVAVTNIYTPVAGVQTMVETTTNYMQRIVSVQTNFCLVTNVVHTGICREAYKFVPKASGRYLFVFKGASKDNFSFHHAQMDGLPSGDDLAFSAPNGTHLDADRMLKLKILCLRTLSETNIYYTVDGSDPRFFGSRYVSALRITAPTVVRAVMILDDGDYGLIYTASYYPALGDIRSALGCESWPNLTFDATACNWFEDTLEGPMGARTIRTIPIGDDAAADLVLTLVGEGVFSFNWRTSSEKDWDTITFMTNGVELAALSGEEDWQAMSVSVSGTTQLTWRFARDEEGGFGNDCAWLASFAFEVAPRMIVVRGPNPTAAPVNIPVAWFANYGLEDMANELSSGGTASLRENTLPRSLYQSYVAGLDPTNSMSRFSANVTLVDGLPVITWSPDLGDERVYTVWGKRNLDDSNWDVVPAGNEASYNFFKVEVEMPRTLE